MGKPRSLVYGIGINDADYNIKHMVNGKSATCPFYKKWCGMLERCYSKSHTLRYPTYNGCTVSNEWLTFSKFKQWMEMQDWEGNQLDKDILVSGNKIYSKETCAFVTPETNSFILSNGARRGDLPLGVTVAKSKYKAQISINGKNTVIGIYDTAKEAHSAWVDKKHDLAVSLASKQKDGRVAIALLERFK